MNLGTARFLSCLGNMVQLKLVYQQKEQVKLELILQRAEKHNSRRRTEEMPPSVCCSAALRQPTECSTLVRPLAFAALSAPFSRRFLFPLEA